MPTSIGADTSFNRPSYQYSIGLKDDKNKGRDQGSTISQDT